MKTTPMRDSDRMEGHQMFRQTLKLEKHINLFFLPVRDSVQFKRVQFGEKGERRSAIYCGVSPR